MQCAFDGLGLGLGRALGLGLADPEVPAGLGDADPLAVAECDALGDGEALGECDREGGLVSETLVPSELSTETPVPLGDAGGRIVVAAPLAIVGPSLPISTYPPAASTTASIAPTSIERRFRWDLRVDRPACPVRPDGPRRSLRRETCAAEAGAGGAGSHTALIAGP